MTPEERAVLEDLVTEMNDNITAVDARISQINTSIIAKQSSISELSSEKDSLMVDRTNYINYKHNIQTMLADETLDDEVDGVE